MWFVTMACNFKCKYCWEVQAQEHGEFKPEPFKQAGEWIEAWSRLRPEVLDITGGEPFLQPGLIDIIKSLSSSGTRIAITSNFSHPIIDFVREVSPESVFSITASYHPTQNGDRKNPMNADVFFGRMLLLREFGFSNVTVNIVAWPEQLWLIPKFVQQCEVHKLRWHVDPYSSITYYPWDFTEAEKSMLRQYVGEDRSLDRKGIGRVVCNGGGAHISVQPDGSAWRCILERQQLLNPLGNIFDKSFSLLDPSDYGTCDQQHLCPGCDRDKVSVVPTDRPARLISGSLPVVSKDIST